MVACGICGDAHGQHESILFVGVRRCRECCDLEMSCAVHEWHLDHLNKDGDALGNKGKGKIKGEGKNDKGKKCKCKGPVSATGEEGRKFVAAWLTDLKEWRAKSKTQGKSACHGFQDQGEPNQRRRRVKSKTQIKDPIPKATPKKKPKAKAKTIASDSD